MSEWIKLVDEITFKGLFDKDRLLKSYIRYYLSRLESMFKYDGLPDTVPAKWLERLLMITGSCVWVKTEEDGLFVNRAAPGADLDIYYIPREVLIVNPYAKGLKQEPYKRDENCVLMLSDTYAQGLMPMIKKSLFCYQFFPIRLPLQVRHVQICLGSSKHSLLTSLLPVPQLRRHGKISEWNGKEPCSGQH